MIFDLVTLTLKFDLLSKNFNFGCYLMMVAARRASLSSDNSYSLLKCRNWTKMYKFTFNCYSFFQVFNKWQSWKIFIDTSCKLWFCFYYFGWCKISNQTDWEPWLWTLTLMCLLILAFLLNFSYSVAWIWMKLDTSCTTTLNVHNGRYIMFNKFCPFHYNLAVSLKYNPFHVHMFNKHSLVLIFKDTWW